MPSILIADDIPSVRRLLRHMLGDLGRTVIEAADGEEALRLLALHRPSLAILDVAMPGLTGIDVCRAVRADQELAGIRIIIVTANGHPDDAQAAREAGADYFLTKPFSPAHLQSVLAMLIG